jgi:hypothetical protein
LRKSLCGGVPEGFCVLPDAQVARKHRHQLREIADKLHRRQMDCVEGTHWFSGKRPAGAGEDVLSHRDTRTARRERPKRTDGELLLFRGEPPGGTSANDAALGLGERERRRDTTLETSERVLGRSILLQ